MFPRTTYAFGSIIGIILLYLFKYYNNKIIKSCIIFLSIFILTTELISFNNIAINRYKTNNKDKHIIVQIENEINKYEQSTGITVTKLALYNLDNATKFYPEVNDTLNVSAISEENSTCISIDNLISSGYISAKDKDSNGNYVVLNPKVFLDNDKQDEINTNINEDKEKENPILANDIKLGKLI